MVFFTWLFRWDLLIIITVNNCVYMYGLWVLKIRSVLVPVWDLTRIDRGDTEKEPPLIWFGVCVNVIMTMWYLCGM